MGTNTDEQFFQRDSGVTAREGDSVPTLYHDDIRRRGTQGRNLPLQVPQRKEKRYPVQLYPGVQAVPPHFSKIGILATMQQQRKPMPLTGTVQNGGNDIAKRPGVGFRAELHAIMTVNPPPGDVH